MESSTDPSENQSQLEKEVEIIELFVTKVKTKDDVRCEVNMPCIKSNPLLPSNFTFERLKNVIRTLRSKKRWDE